MKKAFAMFAAGMIPAMMFATDFTLQPVSMWKKTADDAAVIDYDGRRAWPHLKLKTAEALKPNTLYRITFEAKSSEPKEIYGGIVSVIHGKKLRLYTPIFPTADFQKFTCYFNSGEASKEMPSIYFNPTSAFQMEVKNIKLDEMTDDLLYGKNLIPFGDFEEGNPFHRKSKVINGVVKIVDSANFISGVKSLMLDCPEGKTTMVSSGYLPAIPGKEIEVKFYAKSEEPAKIQISLDWWMSGVKHFYRTSQFKIEKEWKEYTLKFQVPEDFEKYPALSRKLMTSMRFIGQAAAKDASVKIYLDDISYTITK